MKKVAKLVMIDLNDKYLLMYRSGHPVFGIDPDLPGGTLEDGETLVETMLREVEEEAGIIISREDVRELYSGNAILFMVRTTPFSSQMLNHVPI